MKYNVFANQQFTQVILKKISEYSPKAAIKLKLVKWIKKLGEESKDYEAARKALLEKYARKDEAGKAVINPATNSYDIPSESFLEFGKEFEELQAVEFELPELLVSDVEECLTVGELLFMLDYLKEDTK